MAVCESHGECVRLESPFISNTCTFLSPINYVSIIVALKVFNYLLIFQSQVLAIENQGSDNYRGQ